MARAKKPRFERKLKGIAMSNEVFLEILKTALTDQLPDDAQIVDINVIHQYGRVEMLYVSDKNNPLPEGVSPLYESFNR